jgi:Zn-dependent peptidase ImmA (M78 family)
MRKDEEEANRFAADTLIPPDALSDFMKEGDLSNEAVHKVASKLDIGPGIVVGRLQREGLLAYHQGNTLKRKFTWTIDDR